MFCVLATDDDAIAEHDATYGGDHLRVRVLIRPKAGILDPQGQAVERALPALGFHGVRNVHVGRLVELDVEDPSRVGEMCERLLTNPLIEDFQIERPEGDRPSQDAGPDALRG